MSCDNHISMYYHVTTQSLMYYYHVTTQFNVLLSCDNPCQCIIIMWQLIFQNTEEIEHLMKSAGLGKEQLLTDQRLQVNRGKQLKMYRVWIQGKFYKPNTWLYHKNHYNYYSTVMTVLLLFNHMKTYLSPSPIILSHWPIIINMK